MCNKAPFFHDRFNPQSTNHNYSRLHFEIQSTLVISASLISNNRLSRSVNLVPVLTWKSNNRGKEEKLLSSFFHNIFNIRVSLASGVKLHIHFYMSLFELLFSQFCKSDMSRYGYLEVFQRVIRLRDNESRFKLCFSFQRRCGLTVDGNSPVSILRKSISGRHRPVRVADGPMTARCRFT